MKRLIFILLFLGLNQCFAQIKFEDYFENKTLRMDYIHAGNSDTSYIFFEKFKEEKFWGGSTTNLIDKFNYGHYRLSVYDAKTNTLIFSKGYCSLFQEWQTIDEAKKIDKSFYEVALMPFPKNEITVTIEERDKKNVFHKMFEMNINPTNYFIQKEQKYNFNVVQVLNNGNHNTKVDIVFIPDGYTKDEMEKFKKDVDKFSKALFKYEPFKKYKKNFNIWAVEAPSQESGTDIPGEKVWKNTIVNSNFYTFDSERYLTTSDMETLHDLSSLAPCDQIYILVNTAKYGGGGIYNFYNLTCSDHYASELVFVHELGHGFGALADEYWTSETSYNDYYDLTVEPYQPNITTLVDFSSKWKSDLAKSTPVPTPSTKEYESTIGVFEGGGYLEKGIYRPKQHCYMKELEADAFCLVCQKAIESMIKFFSE